MSIIHAIILGFVQGLTEFLPISSSGHLVLVPQLFGWKELSPSVEKTFDVALHAGTLIGAVAYLHKDILKIISSCLSSIKTRKMNQYTKFGLLILVTSIPGALLGALFENMISEHLSQPALVASMLIVFGLVLFFADKLVGSRQKEELTIKDAIIAGASQALALQPGVSRSGITMTALRSQGFTREASARLSFLMLIPIVAGATLFTGAKTITGDGIPHDLVWPMIVGVCVSAITGWIAVYGLLKLLRTKSFTPFVIYRIAAGLGVFAWLILK
ncbi:MAG: undecaprenyl-diphosphate phosphatase [Acidimicrobiia bacterium]